MKDIEITDSENTLTDEISEIEDKEPEVKNKRRSSIRSAVKKAVAAGVGAGLLTVGTFAALDKLPEACSGSTQFSDPAPVVLEIDETDMDISGDTEEEQQEEKKRGIFSWLKIWFYGLTGGIAAFFAAKIPWKKIFNKRNLIVLLVLILLFLCAEYILPHYVDVPWGAGQTAR